MKLIVGLGNPDKQYEKTYHNLGFMCVESAAKVLNLSFSKQKCRALLAEGKIGKEKVILAKPLTYMNLSGESVRELLNFYKIDVKDLVVIYDDFDLDAGVLRIREGGSAGTHNGMRSIIKEIGTEKFARIRVGFKPTVKTQVPLIDLVLSAIKQEDKAIFDKAIERAGNAAADFANGVTLQNVMQKYNGAAE